MLDLAMMLFVLSWLGLPLGIIAASKPSTLRMTDRRAVVAMLTAWWPMLGLVLAVSPRGLDAASLLLWLGSWIAVVAISELLRRDLVRPKPSPSLAEQRPAVAGNIDEAVPDRTAEQVDALFREGRRKRLAETRAADAAELRRLEPVEVDHDEEEDEEEEAPGRRSYASRPRPLRVTAPPRAWLRRPVEPKTRSPAPKRMRSDWRKLPNAPNVKHGRRVAFVYADEDGVITDRELMNWTMAAGRLEGFCITRRDIRTFRLDRVQDWIDWE